MSLIEAIGVLFGLLSVWYAVKENNWTWPLGMVSCVFFGVMFFHGLLYVNVILQGLYVFYNAYSWYMWLYGGDNKTAPTVSLTPARTWVWLALVTILFTAVFGWVFDAYTDNPQPYGDAVTVALSLVAQYMLTRKWLENWWVWIAANVVYFGLSLYAQWYLYAALQVAYIVLSVKGYWDWRCTLRAAAVCDSRAAAVD